MKLRVRVHTVALASLATILALPALHAAGLAPPDVTVTPKPVGSGARALGQSAFIAVADDATAASWNPAGLIQLEKPEFSFVSAWFGSIDHFSSSSADTQIGRETWSQPEVNFASIALPFTVGGHDIVASLNYHQVYDFGLDLGFRHVTRGENAQLPLRLNVESRGAIYATSLACGLSLMPSLSVGGALNLYHAPFFGNRAWEVKTRASGSGTVDDRPATLAYRNRETFEDFRAWNVTLGFLWDAWAKDERRLTFGFVVDTPFTAHLTRDVTATSSLNGPATTGQTREAFDVDFPLSVGAGVNCRLSDTWSVAFDVQWKDWSEFEQKDQSGKRSSPIGGGPTGNIADTLALRLGTEYLFFLRSSVLALRGGIFSEPRPALGDTMDIHGISLGTGWSTKRYSVDFAYQYRSGEDVNGRNLGLPSATRFRIEEHWLVGSVIVYF